MADLAVIVPSRGRPRQLVEMATAVWDFAERAIPPRIRIVVGVDEDDPERSEYLQHGPPFLDVRVGPRRSLSGWTNHLAEQVLAERNPPRFLASLGDDHRPRTPGWDRRLISAIESLGGAPGIAYGDDLLQGAALPTAWVVSADLVRAVGWMMLPTCEHLYVDNAVLALGQATGRILYCPDVVIEHLHPFADKAEMDDSYLKSNSAERQRADREAFLYWHREGGLAADAAKVIGVPYATS